MRLALILLLTAASASAYYPHDRSQPLTRIAFGSCNHQEKPQPQWEVLRQSEPDLWVWLGDNIYADTEDMAVMKAKYDLQFDRPGYAAFRQAVPIIGTWDDHDYGLNGGNKKYPMKRESQQLLLDFLEVPTGDVRRSREGAYAAYVFGPPGRRVKFILLDNRYFSDRPGRRSDILGKRQWKFLQEELGNNTAQFTFIGGGTQMLAVDHGYDHWAEYPRSRKRLLDEIRASEQGGVVLLSGDRHIHEISMVNDETVRYPLFDFTASGLTHSYRRLKAEKNRYRVGPFLNEPGLGLIVIDWDRDDPMVSLRARDMKNRVRVRFDTTLSTLQPNKDL